MPILSTCDPSEPGNIAVYYRQGDEHPQDAIDQFLAVWTPTFRRTAKGGLIRTYEDKTLTVFLKTNGRWAWCIAGPYGKRRFMTGAGLEDQESAVLALAKTLEVFACL